MAFLRRAFPPLIATLLLIPSLALAQEMEVMAISGTPAPDGNGTIASFITDPSDPANPFTNQSGPVLNDAGEIAFVAYLTGTEGGPGTPTDDSGMFLYDGGDLIQLVREGDAPPDSDGVFTWFQPIWPPALNGNGQLAFSHALLESASGEYFEWGVFSIPEPGEALGQVLRQGDPSPDGDGALQFVSTPSFTDSGWIGFMGDFEHETDPLGKRGIFRANINTGEVEVVAREYDDLPNSSSESFKHMYGGDINDSGQLVFGSTFHTENPYGGEGLFLAEDGGDTIYQIIRTGDQAPDGDEVVTSIFSGSRNPINNAGQVAYATILAPCENCSPSAAGIYRYKDGVSETVARTGQSSGNGGLFTGFGVAGTNTVAPALNEQGQLAFAGGFVRNDTLFRGIFRSDGEEVFEIVNNGMPALDGNGYFNLACNGAPGFDCNDTPKMNEQGQVAFFTNIRTPNVEINEGIYFWDEVMGLMRVARKGDPLLGSTIHQLRFTYRGSQAHDNARSGLNNLGQVAYVFELADGRSGVALWTPPARPATATDPTAGVPEAFAIEAAYPNPFREAATLRLTLPAADAVTLAVYDVLGRRVLGRDLGRLAEGAHRVDLGGASLAPGVYVARLTTEAGAAATVRLVKAE